MADQGIDATGPVDLARVPPFRLSALEVHPGTRQVKRDGASETLEPRVMQVLVALAQANGGIITRDELIERCWAGVVVGDNAINRVISRLRQLATGIGRDTFELETITKVGYRMLVEGAPLETSLAPATPRREIDRRLVIGGAAAAIGLGAAGAWRWGAFDQGHDPLPEALELYRRGRAISGAGTEEQTEQAVAYFQEATRVDPNYADAWGALALGYRDIEGWNSASPDASFAERAHSAATRALELDPDNADAQAALLLARPIHGHWAEMEAGLRRMLERHPSHLAALRILGGLLSNVGRWRDSVVALAEADARDPFSPIARYRLIVALWSAGRLQEAETEIERAIARWPRHSAIWETKLKFLTFTGRPAAALAFASDASALPLDRDDINYEPSLAVARALASGDPADFESAIASNLRTVEREPFNALPVAIRCAALGRADTAFELFDGVYLARGPWAMLAQGAPGATHPLFQPLCASLWRDRRFAALVDATGLEAYWRATGTIPDYRRRN